MKRPDLNNFSPFHAIKLGSGVLGKTASVMVAFVALVTVAIYKLPEHLPYLIVGLVGLVAAIVLAYLWQAFRYAERHPGPSVLEGSHLVRFRQNEIAASDPKVIDHLPVGAQGTIPPTQLRARDEDQNA